MSEHLIVSSTDKTVLSVDFFGTKITLWHSRPVTADQVTAEIATNIGPIGVPKVTFAFAAGAVTYRLSSKWRDASISIESATVEVHAVGRSLDFRNGLLGLAEHPSEFVELALALDGSELLDAIGISPVTRWSWHGDRRLRAVLPVGAQVVAASFEVFFDGPDLVVVLEELRGTESDVSILLKLTSERPTFESRSQGGAVRLPDYVERVSAVPFLKLGMRPPLADLLTCNVERSPGLSNKASHRLVVCKRGGVNDASGSSVLLSEQLGRWWNAIHRGDLTDAVTLYSELSRSVPMPAWVIASMTAISEENKMAGLQLSSAQGDLGAASNVDLTRMLLGRLKMGSSEWIDAARQYAEAEWCEELIDLFASTISDNEALTAGAQLAILAKLFPRFSMRVKVLVAYGEVLARSSTSIEQLKAQVEGLAEFLKPQEGAGLRVSAASVRAMQHPTEREMLRVWLAPHKAMLLGETDPQQLIKYARLFALLGETLFQAQLLKRSLSIGAKDRRTQVLLECALAFEAHAPEETRALLLSALPSSDNATEHGQDERLLEVALHALRLGSTRSDLVQWILQQRPGQFPALQTLFADALRPFVAGLLSRPETAQSLWTDQALILLGQVVSESELQNLKERRQTQIVAQSAVQHWSRIAALTAVREQHTAARVLLQIDCELAELTQNPADARRVLRSAEKVSPDVARPLLERLHQKLIDGPTKEAVRRFVESI